MAARKHPKRRKAAKSIGIGLFGSRIARLIFASNLAGLAILIIGALVLNEMRSGLVLSKKNDLARQAQVFSGLLDEGATIGRPEPALIDDAAREQIRLLDLPESVRAKVYLPDKTVVADSFLLSDRVDISALDPLQEPGAVTRWSTDLSLWLEARFSSLRPGGKDSDVFAESFAAEFDLARQGTEAASQRFSDRGRRVISVSVPIQRVSAVVGVLTLESNDIDAIVRAERLALIPFIGVAVLVAFITSALLTLGIARPLRRLAVAADRIRLGSSDKLDIPALSKRKDEIGDLAVSMEAMTDALFERIQANEQFAADVAHELKNPLTSIRSAVETAELVQDNPVAREKLRQVIASDVKRLDRLITDISNASRLEAEMTRIPNASFRIAGFVREIVDTYTSMMNTGEVGVVFADDTLGAGLLVKGREGPLGQVVRNLIDNARSFSPSGGTVHVRLEQGANGPQTTARIIVEDDGPGIPPDKLETIFSRFYTDRPAGAAFGNNSGLGLSIVKQIVATHRGSVHAENRESGGARFVVELPAN